MKRLFDIPLKQLKDYPKKDMFVSKVKGNWEAISTQDFMSQVNDYSRALHSFGITPNDKVAIISNNRVEWNLLDIAILQIGAIVIPVYPNISTKDYIYILNDAEVKLCFVGTEELYEKINEIKPQILSLEKLYCFDQSEKYPHYSEMLLHKDKVEQRQIEELKANVRTEFLATIIYTSGTTGNPKGVMLSHSNIISNVLGCEERIPADNKSRVLTFLPVCHIYERTLHYLYMYLGCSIYFVESMDTIGDNIREIKPHVFTAVPRLIEKVYDKIIAKGEELKGIKKILFFWAVKIAEQYDVKGKSFFYRLKLKIASKLIFSKWREALGGEVKAIASGSAALQARLARIFLAAGIPVLEGYGLTETSPVVSVNCLKKGIMIGTVGPLLNNVKVKIASDGEILVKGPNVMMGYHKQEELTKEVLEPDGWFHTGDIGEIIEEKFLKITDRKKEIFKTSGGKFIIPQAMENKFKESRFIEQVMIIGENQKFPAALIVPNFAFVKDWAKRKGLDFSTLTNREISLKENVEQRIMEEVELFNKEYGHWEQIKKIKLLPAEFTIEENDLTPTLKLKRKIILEKNKHLVNEIYSS
ncbi:MAG: long-chain fatty acid--CoA ligase [Flavobacteriia bacterium]|nr:long-chain fatty acid--CoA ligase [Flavobacteriia bacterium]